MTKIKTCPTKYALKFFKKWSIEIVRDIWFGEVKFTDILNNNPGLSTKILSQRLKELMENGIINKRIINESPLKSEYQLTEKGRALNRIMYDLAMFSYDYYSTDIFENNPLSRIEMARKTARIFNIENDTYESM